MTVVGAIASYLFSSTMLLAELKDDSLKSVQLTKDVKHDTATSGEADYRQYAGVLVPTTLVGGLISYLSYAHSRNHKISRADYPTIFGFTSLTFLYYSYQLWAGQFSYKYQDLYIAEKLSGPYVSYMKLLHIQGDEILLSMSDSFSKSKVLLETQKIFRNIVAQAKILQPDAANLDWELLVVFNPEPTASSLPGGKITISTGMISKLNSTELLALVLGHEAGHVLAKHSGKRVADINIVSSLTEPLSHIPVLGLVHVAFNGLANYLYNLPKSRSNEIQADKIGLYLSAGAGYNPESALQLMDILRDISQEQNASLLRKYSSTHPDSSQRRESLKKYVDEARELYLAAPHKHLSTLLMNLASPEANEDALFFL